MFELCLGFDLHSDILPKYFRGLGRSGQADQVFHACVNAIGSEIRHIKFQSAFFESMGSCGIELLKKYILAAKSLGIEVIHDCKRGDIASTMKSYGEFSFDYLAADSMTVNPYMGVDVCKPLMPWLKKGRKLYIVWISSNSSGSCPQLLKTSNEKTVAEALLSEFSAFVKDEGLEKQIGLVLGATKLESIESHLLEELQHWELLLPGVGVQGGQIDLIKSKLSSSSAKRIIPLSRSLTGIGNYKFRSQFAEINDSETFEIFIKQQWLEFKQNLR